MAFFTNLAFLVYFLFVLITTTANAQNVISPEIQAEIDNLLQEWMTTHNIPGLGLAITRGGNETLYTQGYGWRDLENGLPAESRTLFGIGSITKSFTATIVVKKLNEMFPEMGAAVLDTPIRTLAPGYQGNFTLIDRYRSEATTFRDLLSHKLCTLPELAGMWVQAYSGEDDIFYRQRYAPELCSFRNGYWYNNGIIAMAGDIIAYMTNSTFDIMLSDLLLGIGMPDTTWVKDADDHNNMMGRSVPYFYKDGELIRYNPELLKSVVIVNGAGGILSSADDMLKYMQFHLNLGKVGETQFVSEEAMLWLREISNLQAYGVLKTEETANATVDINIGYGLCLNVGIYDGWLRIGHGGYIPPYESLMNFHPDLKLGIFTTMNGPGTLYYTAEMTMSVVHNLIFDILQGNGRRKSPTFSGNAIPASAVTIGPYPIVRQRLTKFPEPKKSGEIKISPEEAVGVYGSGLNGEMSIAFQTNDDGVESLFWEYGLWGKGWLVQIAAQIFRVEWTTDFWMMSWTNGLGPLNTTLFFLDNNTLQYLEEGVLASTNFERDVGLDDLPEIPWAPGSCVREEL